MSRISRVEIWQVNLPPKVPRSDAIQSFVTQETPMLRVTCDDGAQGTYLIERAEGDIRAALAAAGYPERADPERMNLPGAFAVLMIFVIAATALYGPMAACLVELFPTRIRYTAMSLPYHVGTGWVGGFVPFTAFAIVAATGDIYAGLWYPFAFTLVAALVCLFWLPETLGRSLDD